MIRKIAVGSMLLALALPTAALASPARVLSIAGARRDIRIVATMQDHPTDMTVSRCRRRSATVVRCMLTEEQITLPTSPTGIETIDVFEGPVTALLEGRLGHLYVRVHR